MGFIVSGAQRRVKGCVIKRRFQGRVIRNQAHATSIIKFFHLFAVSAICGFELTDFRRIHDQQNKTKTQELFIKFIEYQSMFMITRHDIGPRF